MSKIEGDDLRRIGLFAEVSDDCCAELLHDARLQSRMPRTTLFEEGERPDVLHMVLEGEVELFAQFNEHETTISVLRPARALNLAAVIDDVRAIYAATCSSCRAGGLATAIGAARFLVE